MRPEAKKIIKLPQPKFAFPQGIDRNEFINLYKLSTVRKISQKAVLIREGDSDQTAFFILSGCFQILKQINKKSKKVAVVSAGNWIGETALIRKVKRTATAVAIEPSVVMAINADTIKAANEKTQIFLLNHFASLSANRIQALEDMEEKLRDANNALMLNLQRQRLDSKIEVAESEVIGAVIKKIPRLPAFARTLTLSSLGDGINLSKIAQHIKQDPSFASVVLKIINSAYYGFKGKISDVHHAVSLLGYVKINQLIISEGLRQALPNKPAFNSLHAHSLAISEISFALSQRSHIGIPAQIATFGLLHDLGKVVLEYLKDQNPILEIFLKALDPGDLGEMLFKEWNYPALLSQCAKYQFYPEFSLPDDIPAEVVETVSVIYVAHLCYDFLCGQKQEYEHLFLDRYLNVLGWKGLKIEDIIERHLMPAMGAKWSTYTNGLKDLLRKKNLNPHVSDEDEGE